MTATKSTIGDELAINSAGKEVITTIAGETETIVVDREEKIGRTDGGTKVRGIRGEEEITESLNEAGEIVLEDTMR